MQDKVKEIKSIISQIKALNEKYEDIERVHGDGFNIFSILGMERNEVETHSKFIYELLNPKGIHKQGNKFLNIFIEHVLSLATNSGKFIQVQREDITKYIKENRRIDFTIETSQYQIGIEMKIDASDQNKQLKDYHYELGKRANQEQDIALFYLTLNGYDASDESKIDLKIGQDYKLISFENEILKWIDLCIEKSATISTLREGLIQYRNLIRKMTNKLSINMENEMENIIKDSEDIKAMQIIMNGYPKIWAKKEESFWDALWIALDEEQNFSEYGYDLQDDLNIWLDDDENEYPEDEVVDDILERRNKKNYWIGFSLCKEFSKKSIQIYIRDWGEGIMIGLKFYNSNTEDIINEKLISICDDLGLNKKFGTLKYKFTAQKVKFYGRYQNSPTYELFDEEEFKRYIKDIKTEIMDFLNLLEIQERKIQMAM